MPVRICAPVTAGVRPEKLVPDAIYAAGPRLPPELTDRVIDYLQHDFRSLATCSLTCRAWLPRTRHHMFRQVRLHCRSGETFAALLSKRPQLGLQVRELLTIVAMSEPRSAWVDDALPDIVLRLPNVTRVVFAGPGLYRTLPLGPLVRLQELVLRSCDFLALDDFVRLLAALPRLERVVLENARVAKSRPIVVRRTVERPVLKSLACIYSRLSTAAFSEWFIQEEMHTALESLTLIPVQRNAVAPVGKFIHAIRDTLKHLSIAFVARLTDGGLCDLLQDHFHLESCSSLQTLHFGSPASNALQYGADDLSFGAIAILLAQVQAIALERLTFSIWHGDHDGMKGPHWDAIVRLLQSPPMEGLKNVTFHIWGPDEPVGRRIIKRLKEQLADLDKRGKLVVECVRE